MGYIIVEEGSLVLLLSYNNIRNNKTKFKIIIIILY